MFSRLLAIWLAGTVLAHGLRKREVTAPNALSLTITSNETVEIPSTLYGYMWEDINHSGDGGLYGELLLNRAFQWVLPGAGTALNAWQPSNGARLSVTNKGKGVSSALPNSLQVQIPKFVSGPVGFVNTGYWGIKVQEGWTYNGSFYARAESFSGPMIVSLKSTSGKTYASKTLTGISGDWTKFMFQLTPDTSAPDTNNVFSVTVDGSSAAGKTLFFGLFSLFPPTFKGRANGMRIDLAEALAATEPGVWRFPGGNNLEGQSFDTRWKWNETIGPLENRPGRPGDWGYTNTDGLGLLEYLDWAEDLGAEPILGVWSGVSIGNYSDLPDWPVIPEADLQPYIDDVINEIEFITANASDNEWGKLRASYGREQPYALKYVEIGNEDQFQPASYAAYRWNAFVSALGEKVPNLEFLATTLPTTPLNPPYKKIDFHQYNTATWFTTNAFMFDNYTRNGTQYFVGEYAVTSTNDTNALDTIANGRFAYPTLAGAAAEAAFMTGMERNADVVFASAYAPSLQHINGYQWTPDIITYDAARLVKSTSYYVQQMFSLNNLNKGTHVLSTSPVSTADTAPLYWVASKHNETGIVYLKMANTGEDDLVVNLFLDFHATAGYAATTSISSPLLSPISGQFNISNTLDAPNNIIPVYTTFSFQNPSALNYSFPASSVTILAFGAE